MSSREEFLFDEILSKYGNINLEEGSEQYREKIATQRLKLEPTELVKEPDPPSDEYASDFEESEEEVATVQQSQSASVTPVDPQSPVPMPSPAPTKAQLKEKEAELDAAQDRIKQLEAELEEYKSKVPKTPEESKTSPSYDPQSEDESPILDMKKPDMGVSYGSSMMRATLVHLDIEEMCRCLGKTIIVHIENTIHIEKEQAELGQTSRSIIPDFFGDESLKDTLLSSVKSFQTGMLGDTLEYSAESIAEIINLKEKPDIREEPTAMVKQQFDTIFNDPSVTELLTPDENDVYNFLKNVIFRSKMEKE